MTGLFTRAQLHQMQSKMTTPGRLHHHLHRHIIVIIIIIIIVIIIIINVIIFTTFPCFLLSTQAQILI